MKRYIYFFLISMTFLLLFIPLSIININADGPHPQGITLDGSIGPVGRLDLAGPDYEIKAEYGKQAGGNLFQSFEQFNLHHGESATFTAPESLIIDNIINRVTNGSPSWIDGTLRSTITGADLYFLNPAGMMFGPHASLDLLGSFHVSTADYLRLGEAERFYSAPIEGEVLSVAPPSAFGFLDDSVAPISFEGSGSFFMEDEYGWNGIKVKDGENISIVGGDIDIKSGMLDDESQVETRIKAPGGRLNIAGVASSGEAVITESDLAVDTFTELGNINISEGSYIDVTGDGGGKVYIRGENFVIDNSNDAALDQDKPASGVYASSIGDVDGGGIDIELRADLIVKNDGSIKSKSYGAGEGRRIEIEAEDIEIFDGGEIVSAATTDSSGDGADIDIQARGSILITGQGSIEPSEIFSYTEGTGDTGDISITAKDIAIKDDARIFGYTIFNGETPGKGPDITINSETLTITGGGYAGSSSYGSGLGGEVSISSTDSISIDGKGLYSSGIYAETFSDGSSGDIAISTRDLTISNEGLISGSIGYYTQVDSHSADIILDVDNLEIKDGGEILTEIQGTGGGGNLFVEAKERILISGKARDAENKVSSLGNKVYWNRSVGIISIKTPKLFLLDEGRINSYVLKTADAESYGSDIVIDVDALEVKDGANIGNLNLGEGRGGDLRISAKENILITGMGQGETDARSKIRAQASGSGSSGNISIKTNDLKLTNQGSISTIKIDLDQDAPGDAGDIRIDVGTLEITSKGEIDSSNYCEGKAGDISISSAHSIMIDGFTTGTTYFGTAINATSTSGNSGKIEISTPELTILNNGVISNYTEDGTGNDILIDTERTDLISGSISSYSRGSGNAGNIYISASDSITMGPNPEYVMATEGESIDYGSHISVSAFSSGNAGSIDLYSPSFLIDYYGYISASTYGSGNGDDINIHVDNLELKNGAIIDSSANASGHGGSINILEAESVHISNGGQIKSSSQGTGSAGNITIEAKGDIKIEGEDTLSAITAQSGMQGDGAGDAGEIFIEAENLYISDGAMISSKTFGSGLGGDIKVDVDDSIILSGINKSNGTPSSLCSGTEGSGDSGAIKIESKNLIIEEGALIKAATSGAGKGGNIDIFTNEDVKISGDKAMSSITAQTESEEKEAGDAGEIFIEARNILLEGSVFVSTTSLGAGKGGKITLKAQEDIRQLGEKSKGEINFITTSSFFTGENVGDAGDIILEAKGITLSGGAAILSSTKGFGNAGNINITTSDDIFISGAEQEKGITSISSDTYGEGDGGEVNIEAKNLYVYDGGMISAETLGPGHGGDITVDVDDSIILSGVNSGAPSSLFSGTEGSGDSGSIKIESKNLIMEDGAWITTATRGAGEGGGIDITAEKVKLSGKNNTTIFANTFSEYPGSGNAGNITVTAKDFSITDSACIGNGTFGTGEGGKIILDVSMLSMDNGYIETTSLMQAVSEGKDAGNAGNIVIKAGDSIDMDESFISSEAIDAGGGSIDIRAQNRVYLLDSALVTSVHGGSEDAGNISIDPRFVILNSSAIIADAHGGRGGNIDIVADYFIRSPDSKISASSDENIDGEISIRAPEVDMAGNIATLPSDFFDASELMQTPCALRTREDVSSLVVKERDGVPFMMDDWLPIHPALPESSYKDIYLALGYQKTGQHKKALSVLLEILPHMERNTDRSLKALFFTTLGDLYLCMGATNRAGDYLTASIEEVRMAGDPILMAAILNNLGNLLSSEGEYVKALATYEEALRLIEEEKEEGKETASRVLINIIRLKHYNRLGYSELCVDMNLLRSLKEMQKEHEDANQDSNKNWFASLRGKTQDLLPDKGSFLPSSLSGDYTGDIMESIEKAYHTLNTLPASYQKAVDMICLGILALDIQNGIQKGFPEYGSKLGNIASSLFIEASGIAEKLENLGLLAYSNGYLGKVYESDGRYQEALILTRKAILAAQQVYFPEILYLWQWQLGRLFEAAEEKDKALKAYDDAIATLKPIQKEFFTGYRNRKEVFNERVRPVYMSYAGLISKGAQDSHDEGELEAKLKKTRDIMEGLKIAELSDYFEDECLIDRYAGSAPLDRTPSRTALLYPIILNDRLSLLLTLPEGMQQTTIMVDSEEVFRTIKRLQTGLQIQNSSAYLRDAQRVYDWIIQPMEDKLMTEGIDTLIMVPDGVFRLIPFAALYDGESYLIEKYTLVTLPTVILTDIESLKGGEETHILISGLSEARQGFPPLPNVQKELDSIHTLIGGKILKDNTFTVENLKQELEYNPCQIVHIATHGVFDSSARESFLLAYDKKITMDSLAGMIQGGVYHDSPIGLLCLSACQTAKGDERAALGLGGIAVKAGARSVIATLWSVDDESTSLLMKEFYNQLKNPGISKAKALQTAQLKILEGSTYKHPFFWAPFLLIGNWL